jgi:hypothetical protein
VSTLIRIESRSVEGNSIGDLYWRDLEETASRERLRSAQDFHSAYSRFRPAAAHTASELFEMSCTAMHASFQTYKQELEKHSSKRESISALVQQIETVQRDIATTLQQAHKRAVNREGEIMRILSNMVYDADIDISHCQKSSRC